MGDHGRRHDKRPKFDCIFSRLAAPRLHLRSEKTCDGLSFAGRRARKCSRAAGWVWCSSRRWGLICGRRSLGVDPQLAERFDAAGEHRRPLGDVVLVCISASGARNTLLVARLARSALTPTLVDQRKEEWRLAAEGGPRITI